MKDEYTCCALNDCNDNHGLSSCCFYCEDKRCPDRCKKKELTFCIYLMKELKEQKDDCYVNRRVEN